MRGCIECEIVERVGEMESIRKLMTMIDCGEFRNGASFLKQGRRTATDSTRPMASTMTGNSRHWLVWKPKFAMSIYV
ncbi:hypothetical protein DY000_02017266 [Brassica cretica]|uniref:Uncharacterized protein n=1 Tax=Brassica cretica TaxID=69181 RepID=A0ABQ7D3X8_BRACR|nr:hypothetical protein DY000_02017266 [Brassica cretica]